MSLAQTEPPPQTLRDPSSGSKDTVSLSSMAQNASNSAKVQNRPRTRSNRAKTSPLKSKSGKNGPSESAKSGSGKNGSVKTKEPKSDGPRPKTNSLWTRRSRRNRSHSPSDSPIIDLTAEDADISIEESPSKQASEKKRGKTQNGAIAKRAENEIQQNDMEVDVQSSTKNSINTPKTARLDHATTPNLHMGSHESPTQNSRFQKSPSHQRIPLQHASQNTPQKSPQKSPQDLNSSPIKKLPAAFVNLSPSKRPSSLFSSSPAKKRKCVAFSDALEEEVVSSPVAANVERFGTPKRSILKASTGESSPIDPNNTALWRSSLGSSSFSALSPSAPAFWQPGTIIQLEVKSPDLAQLVDGCVEVLKDEDFHRKFEVYATLNLICKMNEPQTLAGVFAGEESSWLKNVEKATGYKPHSSKSYVETICNYVKRDLELIESRITVKPEKTLSPTRHDPFESRVLNQALKLVFYFLATPLLNQTMSVSDVRWFYNHACDSIVKPTISKSLVSPYLSIIKDCHFTSKRRKSIFEAQPNPLSEKILFALLNMRSFLSSSLINEKFIALRNAIQNFPAMSAKNFHLWFPGLVLNLCDLSFVLYSKVIGTGITTLLEAARNYLDSKDVCKYTQTFMESPLVLEHKSWVTENLLSMSPANEQLTITYVIDSLRDLLDNGHHRYAMDIWVALSLLMGTFDEGIENWEYLTSWLHISRRCLGDRSVAAKSVAISSWKAMVYKVCCHELHVQRSLFPTMDSPAKASPNTKQNSRLEETLRPKFKLLLFPFVFMSNQETKQELAELLHGCFLSILYNLLNFPSKYTTKFIQVCWDKAIQPVLLNFYFKKDISTAYTHELGLAVINRLLTPTNTGHEKSYNSVRCLSNEPINVSEINCLNPRWLYLRFEKVLPMLSLVFKSDKLGLDAKTSALSSFMSAIKIVIKKDAQTSDTTFDLIDNLPFCVEALFERHELEYESMLKLLVNLNDTFGAANLVPESYETKSVYESILIAGLPHVSRDDTLSILSMLNAAVGEKKVLQFLALVDKINRSLNMEVLDHFIQETLNAKKFSKFSHSELVLLGKMFERLADNFMPVAKKVIQQIVLLKPEDFDKISGQLGIANWNVGIFKFFLVLMHDAPYEHLKQATLQLISAKIKEPGADDLMMFMLEHKFESEIHRLRDESMSIVKSFGSNGQSLWTSFIKEFAGSSENLDDILVSASAAGIDCEAFTTDLGRLPKYTTWLQFKNSQDTADSVSEAEIVIISDDNVLQSTPEKSSNSKNLDEASSSDSSDKDPESDSIEQSESLELGEEGKDSKGEEKSEIESESTVSFRDTSAFKQVSDSEESTKGNRDQLIKINGSEIVSSSEEKSSSESKVLVSIPLNTSDESLEFGLIKCACTEKGKTVQRMSELMEKTTNEEIGLISDADRYSLESRMMEFILRMRQAKRTLHNSKN